MTDSSRKTTLGIAGDASGFKSAADQVKQAARDMAQDVAQSSQQASKAVSGMGDGAASAAAKVVGSQSSIADAVKKTTQATQEYTSRQSQFLASLERQATITTQGKAAYLELRAAQLGVGEAASAAISKIRAAEAAQVSLGSSAQKTAYQLRQVAPQVTDIVTQLAAGQAPLQILIQQGGQLKDVFGGVGPAAKALGGYLAGLITPTTILAGGLGVLALAYIQGAKEAREFTKAAILSGSELANSLSNYTTLRDSLTDIATKGKAAEVLTAIAAKGELAGDSIKQIAQAAILMEKATGQAADKTIQAFVDLAKSPTEAVAKLNEQYNFLTSATYAQIKALEEHGKKQDAANLAEQTYAEALKSRAQSVVDSAGTMEKAWRKVWDTAKGAWDAMAGIGRQLSTAEQLAQVQAKIAKAQGPFDASPFGGNAELRAQLPELKEQAKFLARKLELEQSYAYTSAQDAQLEKDKIDFIKEGNQYLDKRQQMEKEIARERERDRPLIAQGLLTEEQLNQRILDIRKKYADTTGEGEVAGLKARLETLKSFNAELEKQIRTGIFPTDEKQPTQAEQKVIALQKELAGSIMGKGRAEKEAALAVAQATVAEEKKNAALIAQRDLLKKSIDQSEQQASAVYDQAEAIRQQASEQEAANLVFGKGRVAVEELRLAQLKKQLADLDETDNVNPKYIAGLNAKIAAQERLVDAVTKAADKQLQFNSLQLHEANQRDADLLQYELSVVGQVADVRALLVERRRIELEYAKKIADIDRGEGSPEAKAQAKAVVEQEKAVALTNATTKAVVEKWQRASDEISDALTNAFVDAFENGGNLGKNLANALKREFANLVLKPTIQAVINSTGIPQALGQAVGAGGNPLSSILGTAIGGSGATLGTALGYAAASAGITNIIGSAVGLKGNQLTAATITAALTGPLPGLIVGSLVKPGGGPKVESGSGGPGTPQAGDPAAAQAVVDSIKGMLQTAGAALGVQLAQDVGVYIAKDPQGTALTQLAVHSANYDRGTLYGTTENVGRSDADLQKAIQLAGFQDVFTEMRAAIDKSGLTGAVADFVKSIDPAHASLEELSADFQKIQIQTLFDKLGLKLFDISTASNEAADALVQASGGLDKLAANAQTYAQNFLTPEEQRMSTVKQITATLTSAGVQVTADQVASMSREAFRALVDSFDATTTDGAKAVAALYSVAGSFASITDAANGAAGALSNVDQIMQPVADDIARVAAAQKQSSIDFANAQQAGYASGLMKQQQEIADLTQQLLGLAEPMKALAAQHIEQYNTLNSDAARALQLQIFARQDLQQAQKQVDDAAAIYEPKIQALLETADNLGKFAAQLGTSSLGGLDPKSQYAQTRANLSKATTDNVQDLVQRFLDAAKNQASTRLDYLRDVALARKQVQTEQESAISQANYYRESLNAMQAQVYAMRALLPPIDDISGAIFALKDAILSGYFTHIPGYASGGSFGGGIALVGEKGPELIKTGPAQIINSVDTARLLSGTSNAEVLTELALLRAAVSSLQKPLAETAKATNRMDKTQQEVVNGNKSYFQRATA